jgi:cytochrome c oxidase subunit II
MTTPDSARAASSKLWARLGPLAGWAVAIEVTAGAPLGCSGEQSALEPGGQQAETLARLFWWMTAGAGVIWLAVIGVALYTTFTPARQDLSGPRRIIVWGGVIIPTAVLTALLCYGLALLPDFLAPAAPGSRRITVSAEQYWWRVRYVSDGGGPAELANEVHLPVGEEVEFSLESRDVIHSFWIPSLAGKVDMIPGRRTRLRLLPTRVGQYRGACAEYCGASHALMSFVVVVEARVAFERWLTAQAGPARVPHQPLEQQGRDVLLANGCGACHTLRGTAADGTIGPDLTHVGGRRSLVAGVLPSHAAGFGRWLAATEEIKPGVHMPAFGMLPAPDLLALAAYLESLQ